MKPNKASDLILVADDEPSMRLNITELLEDEGYSFLEASTGTEAVKLTLEYKPRVILMDIKMPGMTGLQALRTIKKQEPGIPVIIFTAFGSNEKPIEAMKAGAFDYLDKPFEIDEFLSVIRKALRQGKEIGFTVAGESDRETALLRAEEHIICASKKMKEILKVIGKVANKNTTVLIEGESGTGKEVIADTIHRHSKRANGPFIKVNCGALPESLLESELFGHEQGAFTGAIKQRRGRFELADGGTIFLDEVNTLTPAMQIRLLRVLQQFTFERVGGEKTIKTDARVIAATNKDLKMEIAKDTFREDLFYRLNVLHLAIPPLRERTDDIEPLVNFFLKKYSPNKTIGISPEALKILQAYHWPGNVRELENMIHRATLLMQGKVLTKNDLSVPISRERSGSVVFVSDPENGNGNGNGNGKIPFKKIIEATERDLILKALKRTGWNKTGAAKLLDINRRLLYSKMKQYEIEN